MQTKWNWVLVPSLLVLTCLSAPFMMGQSAGSGSVVGVVHDPSGAVVEKAVVILTNINLGTTQATKTSSAGQYTFPIVVIGTYNITVTAPGFSQSEQQGIVVSLNKTVSADVVLQSAPRPPRSR